MKREALAPKQRDALNALLRRPAIRRLFAALDGRGEHLRLVGGAVRDALLGLPVEEIDLATTALPEETMARAQRAGLKTAPTGIEHGTITVIVDGAPFEITTLREDVETDGRHARVRFGRDFDADGLRRDFTINALSLDAGGRLHDPAEGLLDLGLADSGLAVSGSAAPWARIRFIGDPETRIREDYLRSLRFFRFHARLGHGPPDAAGFDAAIRCREGLDGLSRERVRAELLKLLAAPGAASAIADLSGAGLLHRISGMVAEPGRLARLMARQQASDAPADPLLRLAACGVRIVEDARRLHERLRLSGAEATRLTAIARAMEALTSIAALDQDQARTLAATLGTGAHGTGAPGAATGARALHDALAILADRARPIVSEPVRNQIAAMATGAAPAPTFPLRGADLLALGVEPGPEIGAIMAMLRTQWLAQGCPDDDDFRAALLAEAATLAAQRTR